METVAIIPARGGSKGIPKKNLLPFCGYPLLAWSIACARRCTVIDRVFVSTDSVEISNIAREYGASPIERPSELSTDFASSESALLHALDVIEKDDGELPQTVVFLQATSPLRETSEIESALAKFRAEDLDSLFSAAELSDMHIWKKRPEVSEAGVMTFECANVARTKLAGGWLRPAPFISLKPRFSAEKKTA